MKASDSTAPNRKKRLRRGWPGIKILLVAAVLGIAAGFATASLITAPRAEGLETFRPNIITHLYDIKGTTIADYALERRIVLEPGEIPPTLKNAILAAEDSRFYQHGGIDPVGIARALQADIREGRLAQGASTLTQQLARLLFLTPDKRWRRKLNEIFLAIEIEKKYTKHQIFAWYANQVYLGSGVYGVEAAAEHFFGKHAKDLTVAEAALIAGLIQRPEAYSPLNHPASAVARRNYILQRMRDEGFLKEPDYSAAVDQPLELHNFLAADTPAPYFAEDIRQYLEKTYGAKGLYYTGLKVHTTLDLEIQKLAEAALNRGLRRLDKRKGFRRGGRNLLDEGVEDLLAYEESSWKDFDWKEGSLVRGVVLEAGPKEASVRVAGRTVPMGAAAIKWTGKTRLSDVLRRGDLALFAIAAAKDGSLVLQLDQEPVLEGSMVVIDNATGAIRAMVGGYDFRRSKFNRASQANRQVGSTYKPLVYAAALEEGFTPADMLFDSPISLIGADGKLSYKPQNFYNDFQGITTVQHALDISQNIPAIKVITLIHPRRVIDFSRRAGIVSPLPPYASLALGSADITLLEMCGAFAVFPNQGIYTKPYYIDRITDSEGYTLEESVPEPKEATSPAIAFVATHMMRGVIERGTGYEAKKLGRPLGGKTGTTDSFTDAWFVGFSPEITVGVWVGYDEKKPIGYKMTGAVAALPIWIDFWEHMPDAKTKEHLDFEVPANVVFTPIDYYTGLRAVPECRKVILEAFVNGSQPQHDCSPEWHSIMALPWSLQRAYYTPRERESM